MMTDKFQLRQGDNHSAKQKNQPPENRSQQFCGRHQGIPLNWRCVECGGEFCDRCVSQIREHWHLDLAKSAVCPECRGMCKDFREEAAKLQQAQQDELANRKNALVRNAVWLILSVPFLLEAARWSVPFWTTELKFLLMVTAIFAVGPLRNVDLVYKCGALLYFMWLAHPMLAFALLLGSPSGEAGRILFKTPAKYLAESVLIVCSFFLLEKVSEAISSIYYRKGEAPPAKFGVRGWVLTAFSFVLILAAAVMGFMNWAMKSDASSMYDEEISEARRLSRQFTEEISRDSVNPARISRLETEISNRIYPFKENREIDRERVRTLNTLLEPYRRLTMAEAWHYFERGKEKLHEDRAVIDHIKTKIFERDFGRYKTVGDVIDGGDEFDVFAKHYLYMHLLYGGGP